MPITGTGTGPFTITGTETTLAIFNYVVGQNLANASKNSDNTNFDFNCVLNVGNGSTVTVWNSSEEAVRIDASSFTIAVNATLNIGLSNPSRGGSYWRWQITADDQFIINGNINGYASRLYASRRVRANTGSVSYFEECAVAFLDSIDNVGGGNPNINYVRCFVAGASAVAVKLGGNLALTGTKISGAGFAFQPLPVSGQSPIYTVNDYVGQGNGSDAVPNQVNANTQLNIIGAFDGATGVPRTSLITSQHANGNTVRLRWRYNLASLFNNAGQTGTTVRIRNINNTVVYSGSTNGSGAIPQQILNRFEYINSSTGIPRFPYQVKLRKYDRTSQELVYNADNHTTQQAVHLAVPFLVLTEAQAAALTGIEIVGTSLYGTTSEVAISTPQTFTATAKRVRYVMLRRQATSEFDIAELEVFSGGVNVALNKTVTVGSQGVFPGSLAARAVDGNLTTSCDAGAANANSWLQVDLGQEYEISSVRLTPRSGFAARFTNVSVYTSVINLANWANSVSTYPGAITPLPTDGIFVTLNDNRTESEFWQFYRAWISQLANFDSEDTWTYDGEVLNMGAWNLTVNTGITFTGNIITTGTVTNNGTINGTYTDTTGTRVTIKTADNLALSTYLTIDGVPQAWQTEQTARNIFVTASSVVRIYAHSYGYQPKIINIVGNTASDYIVNLLPESNVDTSQDTTIRNTIANAFDVGADSFSRLFLSVNADLRQYTPAQVMNALHYFTVTEGELIATSATFANSVAGFSLMRGGFIIASTGFYGKVADSVTTTTNLGILVPLSIYVDPSVYVAMPTYTPVEKNTSSIVLQYAPWTQQEADIPSWVAQEASVINRPTLNQIEGSTILAKEATLLQTKTDVIAEINANEVKIDAIKAKTDILVNTDISALSKKADTDLLLKASDYTAPNNTQFTSTDRTKLNGLTNYDDTALIGKVDVIDGVVDSIKEKTDTLVNTDLSSVAKTSELTTAANEIIIEVNQIPTNPLLASSYVEPDNTTIGLIKAKVDTLQNADFTATNAKIDTKPSLIQIEASTVLAKEATILQTETDIIAEINANEVKIDAIKAKTDTLVNAPTLQQIEASTVLAKEVTSQTINTKVETLSNYDDTTVTAKLDAIKSKTDQLVFTGANLNTVAKVVEDKTGYALTAAERESIAVVVESHLLNENDGQAILNAIVNAIGNQNIDELALVAAIRADIERAGGTSALIKAKVDTLENTDISTLSKKADTDLLLKDADYVAPDNDGITKIKTNTDLIPATL